MKNFKILGFSEDHTNCERCGKSELKGTYALQDNVSGHTFRLGSSCIKKAYQLTQSEFKTKVDSDHKIRLEAAKSSDKTKTLKAAFESGNSQLAKAIFEEIKKEYSLVFPSGILAFIP